MSHYTLEIVDQNFNSTINLVEKIIIKYKTLYLSISIFHSFEAGIASDQILHLKSIPVLKGLKNTNPSE